MQTANDNVHTQAWRKRALGGNNEGRSSAERVLRPRKAKKWRPGMFVATRELATISGDAVRIPDAEQLIHLQFRRFAGCPVCNLHLQSMARRHGEIVAAGIREVVVFHSTAEELLAHAGDLPFDVVADPSKRLYAEFGVESSPRALFDPRVWVPILRALLHSLWAIIRGQRSVPAVNPEGGRLGLPADFLIASDGRMVACKYGVHADDQWSVDELLGAARAESASLLTPEREAIHE